MTRIIQFLNAIALAGILFQGSCLPDNFWADKWGEVVNRSIFGVINTALTNAFNVTI
jgi:hypothetical protein